MTYRILFLLLLSIMVACNSHTDQSSVSVAKPSTENPYPDYVQQLFTAVKQKPDSTGLRLKLAIALDSTGFYKQSLLQMDSLIKKDSSNYGLWYTRGQIAEDAGDTSLAIEDYDRALHIYPSPDALLNLANLYAEQRNEKALLICTQLKQMGLGREYDADCSFIEGVYNARTGNKQKAVQFFNDCIANEYTYMEAYIEKGLVFFDSKDYRKALDVFNFASTVNALDADPYYWQGRCYEMMNIQDSAVLRFKQSFNLDNTSQETKNALKRLGA